MSIKKIALIAAVALAAQAQAQSSLPTAGTLVIVPANGEVTHVNDEATVTFAIEEQDKDKSVAASRVNQKMKQGTEIVRKEDPKATLKTMGYYTYPVYPQNQQTVVLNAPDQVLVPPKPPVAVGWRVGQYLEVKTTAIGGLPKMTAAVQKVLALNGINFGLSPATTKQLDDKRIAATYQNLNERIASIAAAMGRKVSDATLETVDFEGSGNYAGNQSDSAAAPRMASFGRFKESAEVAEPSFEPGETTLQMRLVGKVKFK